MALDLGVVAGHAEMEGREWYSLRLSSRGSGVGGGGKERETRGKEVVGGASIKRYHTPLHTLHLKVLRA